MDCANAACHAFAFIGFLLGQPLGEAFKGALIVDNYSHYVNMFLGLSAAAALMFSKSFFQTEKLDRFEYSVLVLYAVLGMSIMASANSLLSLYIGIELQSLALYVMAAFNRDSLRASEAGSLEFDRIAQVVSEGATPGIIAGMVFLLCGLAFKISAAPFHMWTPDVYEGSPTPVTGFLCWQYCQCLSALSALWPKPILSVLWLTLLLQIWAMRLFH